ncbi:deoxyribonuclease-1-like isoform X3 [Betta splendens]|uniref:Deoxyribonuclease-1-like isoform X3 n=1 Tax=Betta splendens TaxID=158456 RepID=A0A6P7MK69_BETSP|nr:deoxyribonuclease-1-like isoform X3 [Betta splendens]
MSRYSIVVMLEVVDKSGKAMEKLLKELNAAGCGSYSMTASCQLGRDTYKEKFVCFYRSDEATLTDCYQYEDNQAGDEDAFAREPFVLRFSCPDTAVKDLILIPVHTKPEDSLKELDELHDVVQAVRSNWGSDNIMILGDFNADGRYLSKRKKQTMRICSEPYHWLITDDVDTTSSNNNDNTYDRIVVYGEKMLEAVVSGSAKSFNYQEEFNLTDEETLSVSDHYPVEVELKTDQNQEDAAPTRPTAATKGRAPKKGPQKKTEPTAVKKRNPAPKKKSGDAPAAAKAPTKRRRVIK